MGQDSKIEWTDATWNPVAGCTRISPGCQHCYAETMGKRLRAMALADQKDGKNPGRKAAYIDAIKPAGGWSGNLVTIPDALRDPLTWKRPRRIFVNSMSDLFHDAVPFEFIDQVFAVMYASQWHTFQVLTKRSERMRGYFEGDPLPRIAAWAFQQWTEWSPEKASQGVLNNSDIANDLAGMWPLPNVCLGVSVENQAMADKRKPDLLLTPATVRFLSCEPLLGPICDVVSIDEANVDWVIVGGESGPHARPMHPDWARSLRDQCQAAGVPFFFKQWGEWKPLHGDGWPHGDEDDEGSSTWTWITTDGVLRQSGSRPDAVMQKVGKNLAGRLLDGRTWNMFPGDGVEYLLSTVHPSNEEEIRSATTNG